MPRSSRFTVVLLLVSLLLPATLKAAETQRGAEPTRNRPAVLTAWDALSRLWTALTAAHGDNGCRIEPSGKCLPDPRPDNGCVIDPDGRCLS